MEMSTPTRIQTEIKVERIVEEESLCNDSMFSPNHLDSKEFVNSYDSKFDVLKQVKREISEDENPESSLNFTNEIVFEADSNESCPDIPASPSSVIQIIPSTITSDRAQFVAPSSRKYMKKTLPQNIYSNETLQSIKEQAIVNREIEDKFYHFGKNVASQLRELPLLDALDVQTDIFNLIKIKRQSILRRHKQANCSSNESLSEYFHIELPDSEHMFLSQRKHSESRRNGSSRN